MAGCCNKDHNIEGVGEGHNLVLERDRAPLHKEAQKSMHISREHEGTFEDKEDQRVTKEYPIR